MIGVKDEGFPGMTGDGGYAVADADRFGSFGGSAPRHRAAGRPGTEIALGYVKPAPTGRRGRWSRVG